MPKKITNFNKNTTTEHAGEHTFELKIKAFKDSLKKKKTYTGPKFYHGGESYDLSKRWYVYFRYRKLPGDTKLTRSPNFYLDINKLFKTKKERLHHFRLLIATIKDLLDDGYIVTGSGTKEVQFTAESLIDHAIELKRPRVSEKTLEGYIVHANKFKEFLTRKKLNKCSLKSIRKKDISEFLQEELIKNSPATRNNIRSSLNVLYNALMKEQEDNEYLEKNPIPLIEVLKSNPQFNRIYSKQQRDDIFGHLEKQDQLLLLYIMLMSFNMLRGISIVRLRICDVDLSSRNLYVNSKTGYFRRMIPEILVKYLKQYLDSFPNKQEQDYLFTPNGIGQWNVVKDADRRQYFTKRFKRKVKIPFNLPKEYTMHSFRHYFITFLYSSLRKQYSILETEDRLMQCTGHSSRDGLRNYLRTIQAERPEDFSNRFSKELGMEIELDFINMDLPS